MKKLLSTLFISLTLILFAQAANEIVLADPATFTGTLPANSSIEDIDGVKYFKITLDAWNTNLDIEDVASLGDVNKLKFSSKLDVAATGVDISNLHVFVQPANADYSAKFSVQGLATADFSDFSGNATANANVTQIQLAAQNDLDSWNAVTGAILYIGKITAYKEEMQNAQAPKSIVINKLTSVIDIDGISDFDKEAENAIEQVALGTVASANDNSGFFKAMWDAENLYIYAEITDDDPLEYGSSTKPWENDGVEIFVDVKNRRFQGGSRIEAEQHQLRINNGRVDDTGAPVADQDGLGENKMTIGQIPDAAGFTVELAIPWTGICNGTDVTPNSVKNGSKIAFEISILDADQLDHRKSIMNWSNNTGKDIAYTSNQYYGEITLSDGSGTAVKNTNTIISNIKYNAEANLIVFANTTDASVYDIAGKLVIKANNVNNISTSSLYNGVYIVVAGKEKAKFIK